MGGLQSMRRPGKSQFLVKAGENSLDLSGEENPEKQTARKGY